MRVLFKIFLMLTFPAWFPVLLLLLFICKIMDEMRELFIELWNSLDCILPKKKDK